MDLIAIFSLGFILGLLLSSLAALSISRRLFNRLKNNFHLEEISDDLERRRAARDFGRTERIQQGAGPAGIETNLFPARPGRAVLNRLSEKRATKLPKGVDTDQDSTTLMESGSNTDQTTDS